MSEKNFIEKYLEDFSSLVKPNADIVQKILEVKNILVENNKNNKKTIIFGNGGSAAIASHFSVDLTKNAKVRCFNFNESDLITCFSNDYGYEKWVEKAVEFYGDEGDVLIIISASGKSQNMINAAKFAKLRKNPLVTFTGFFGKNKLSKYGSLNFIVNSRSFNFIENTHQYWLLSLVDIISEIKK